MTPTSRAPGRENPHERKQRLIKEIRSTMAKAYDEEGKVDHHLRQLNKLHGMSSHYFTSVETTVRTRKYTLTEPELVTFKMETLAHLNRMKSLRRVLDKECAALDMFCYEVRNALFTVFDTMEEEQV